LATCPTAPGVYAEGCPVSWLPFHATIPSSPILPCEYHIGHVNVKN
jgi:hypothetical protein